MVRVKRDKKYRLTIYLMKKDCANHSDVLKGFSSLKRYDLQNYRIDDMALYVKESHSFPPLWAALFSGHLKKNLSGIYNSSSSAALIVKNNRRYYAFAFGYGGSLLNPQYIEEAFRLKVALNSIDHDKIKSVDIRNHDTILRQSRVQTSQASSVDSFGMNIDRDILNGVTGLSNDPAMGKSVTGGVALHISLPVNVNDLTALCATLWKKFQDSTYKKFFPWVDHIQQVKNPALIDSLNMALLGEINKRRVDHIYLAVPELVEWKHIEGFKYKPSDEEIKEDIALEDILPPEGEAKEISLGWLKRKEVLCIAKENEQIYGIWSLYNCINCEVKRKKETYLLTAGKWFKIDSGFVATVDSQIARIPEYRNFSFPQYEEKREFDYNSKVYNQNKDISTLMDNKIIRHGGSMGQVEFCDLILNKKDFVHVKRFRGSSTLSHLFQQGFNSAFLFLTDQKFVEKVNKKLPPQWRFDSFPTASECEVVYAIISKASGRVKGIIPFFSKVSLIQIFKQLRAYGFKVSVAKIGM